VRANDAIISLSRAQDLPSDQVKTEQFRRNRTAGHNPSVVQMPRQKNIAIFFKPALVSITSLSVTLRDPAAS